MALVMRPFTISRIAAVFLAGFLPACSGARTGTDGSPLSREQVYVGTILAHGGVPIRLTITGPTSGTIEYPTTPGTKPMSLTESRWSSGKVRIAWTDDDGSATIDGTISGGSISGTFTQGETSGPAHLIRGARLDSTQFARLHGLYELAPGHVIWVGPVSELGLATGYVDSRSGTAGLLFPTANGRLIRGATALSPVPPGPHIDTRSASATAAPLLFWHDGSLTHAGGKRIETYTTEDVTFTNGGVRLSGTLIKPAGAGPHPAVVFIHGAGAQRRTYFSGLPYFLAHAGVAALVYDKRGVGQSTGDRRTARFTDFADDAIAGVRYLQSRADIARDRVGVYGHSQGGWHAQLAATRSNGDVAFAVIAAGPAKNYQEQTNDELLGSMRFTGASAEDMRKAIEHQNLYWRVVRRQAPYDSLAASAQRARVEPWGRFVWKPSTAAAVLGDTLEYIDPAPVLAKLTIPVLAIYGSNDIRVNARDNAALLDSALRRAGNANVTIRTLAGADHDFWTARSVTARDVEGTTGYTREFFPTVIDWIAKQARARPPKDR